MEKCVQELIGSWTAEELKKLEENVQTGEPISSDEGREELQALLLGYYYALLLPLIDCSSLIQQEAYGSWGFHSHRFLNLLFTIIRQSKQSTVRSSGSNWVHKFSREAIFYLTAFLFAGCESSSPVFEVGGKTIGLTSKLSLVSSILLGKSSNVEDAPKYCLLDCDMSAFPSTASGRIRDSSGSSGGLFVNRLQKDGRSGNFESILAHLNLDEFEENKGDSDDGDLDFTCHIEPDWDNDSTRVVLAFRHNGRIVSRTPALSILEALVSWKDTLDTDIVISRERKASRSQLRKESALKWKMADFSFLTSASRVGSTVIFAEPSGFHGNHVALPVPSNSDGIDITRITASDSHKQIPKPGLPKDFGQIVFAILCRMPKAALCVTAMYQEFRDRYNVSMTTALVRSPEDLRDELEDGASVIVVY
ncbi:MAG: hypothetical protein M1822_009508 [Bathelium mastoideum]|nr:MAG: hypothetical protein M1822_009508 [Bathelium mastoideum]